MEIEFLIPIALFAAIALISCAFFYFRHRSTAELQQTIRTAVEQGQQLTPEFLERLGGPVPTRLADLRRGIIAMAIGLGLAAFGVLLGQEDALQPMLAIGAIPFIIGIAYLGMWKFLPHE